MITLRRAQARPPTVPSWVYAWTTFEPEPFVNLAAPQAPFIVGRAWHEIEHARDRTFTNATHHPWTHFCVRSVAPFRLPYHAEVSTRADALELLRGGKLDR